MMLLPAELARYNRQILLPELGVSGQQKIRNGSVLVIGAGGLGSPALLYLAAAGIGRLGIVDFDVVDESNLQRQILYDAGDIGCSKVEKAKARLMGINPRLEIDIYPFALNTSNAMEIILKYDVIIDGTDNLPTRYMVNDACLFLNKPLIYGAIFQFEGQVSVFNQLLSDGSRGPNYRDLFPEPPNPEMVPSCNVGGVLGALPGIIGSMQAIETLKIIAGIGKTLSGRLLIFDGLDFTTHILTLKANPDNPVSGKHPTIRELIDYEEFCNPAQSFSQTPQLSTEELQGFFRNHREIQIIDVREPFEYEAANIGGINIPLGALNQNVHWINKDVPVVLICKSGQRSNQAIHVLQELGYKNAMNLKGGLLKWKEIVDPALPLI